MVFGEREVFGHQIAAVPELTDEHSGASGFFRKMEFAAQYLHGKGPAESLTAPRVNETPIDDYPNMSYDTRLGTASQSVMDKFEQIHQTYHDGRTIPKGENSTTAGGPNNKLRRFALSRARTSGFTALWASQSERTIGV